jgi:hypothetical protein
MDKFGKCKGIDNEVGNLAMTSRIHHLQHGDNHSNQLKDILVGLIEMWLQNWLNTNMK